MLTTAFAILLANIAPASILAVFWSVTMTIGADQSFDSLSDQLRDSQSVTWMMGVVGAVFIADAFIFSWILNPICRLCQCAMCCMHITKCACCCIPRCERGKCASCVMSDDPEKIPNPKTVRKYVGLWKSQIVALVCLAGFGISILLVNDNIEPTHLILAACLGLSLVVYEAIYVYRRWGHITSVHGFERLFCLPVPKETKVSPYVGDDDDDELLNNNNDEENPRGFSSYLKSGFRKSKSSKSKSSNSKKEVKSAQILAALLILNILILLSFVIVIVLFAVGNPICGSNPSNNTCHWGLEFAGVTFAFATQPFRCIDVID